MKQVEPDSVKDKSIKDTGERMVPAYHRGHMVYGEHLVRYQSAQQLASDKVVLDIASGSGYGSALLGRTAKQVYGVDVNDDAITYAVANYSSSNVTFHQSDGVTIPLETDSVDLVVSFETIEHIENYRAFMKEVKRVLKSDGLFILSTPNDVEFSEGNHYHLHEFEEKELSQLISEFFTHTESYYQGTWLYTALMNKKKLSTRWSSELTTLHEAPVKPEKAIYFFVLCANRPVTEKLQPLGVISEHWSARKVQEYEVSVRKHMDDQRKVMDHLSNELRVASDKLDIAVKRNGLLEKRFGRLNKLVDRVTKRLGD